MQNANQYETVGSATVSHYQSMKFEFLDEDIMALDNCEEFRPYDGPEQGSRWTLFFDGSSNALGNGISVVLISSEGCHTPFTARLFFNCTNNIAEYEACIFSLRAAMDLGIKSLDVFGDSGLVISQIKGEWDTKQPNLIPYKEHVLTLLPYFEKITFEHFPREEKSVSRRISHNAINV